MGAIGPIWRMYRLEIVGMLVAAAAIAYPLVKAVVDGGITYAPPDCMAARWTARVNTGCGDAVSVWLQLFQRRLVLFQAVLVIAGRCSDQCWCRGRSSAGRPSWAGRFEARGHAGWVSGWRP